MESPKDSPLSPKKKLVNHLVKQMVPPLNALTQMASLPPFFPATPVDLSHVCSKDAAASSDPSEMHNRMEDRTLAKFTHMHMYVYIYIHGGWSKSFLQKRSFFTGGGLYFHETFRNSVIFRGTHVRTHFRQQCPLWRLSRYMPDYYRFISW